jgi:hypothetical protein
MIIGFTTESCPRPFFHTLKIIYKEDYKKAIYINGGQKDVISLSYYTLKIETNAEITASQALTKCMQIESPQNIFVLHIMQEIAIEQAC